MVEIKMLTLRTRRPIESTHCAIIFPIKHGIGDELSLGGPLISALIDRGDTICILTFHPELYFHSSLSVFSWQDEFNPFRDGSLPICDIGICFNSQKSSGLSHEFDRSFAVIEPCKDAGWTIVDDAFEYDDEQADNFYAGSELLAQSFGMPKRIPPWPYLPRREGSHILLNLVGKGDAGKGLPHHDAWVAIEKIVTHFPDLQFIVIQLRDEVQMEPPVQVVKLPNLKIKSLLFGDKVATEIYCRSRLIVTAEGGGYHMAYGAAIPSLLVTPRAWYDIVKSYALPPGHHNTLLFDSDSRTDNIAHLIIDWIRGSLVRAE